MNILVITDKLYPDENGGSCMVAYETIQEWQKNNSVDIFTCPATHTTDDRRFKGTVNRSLKKVNPFSSAMYLRNMIKAKEYNILVVHSIFSWLVYYLALFPQYSADNLFVIFHGPWHKEAKYKYYGQGQQVKGFIFASIMLFIERLYCHKNCNFIFLSNYMRSELSAIDYSITSKNVCVIPGGVRLEHFKREHEKSTAKKKLGIDEKKIVLFSLRRLDKRMGIDTAIEALISMEPEKRNKFILLIGGSGNYREVLEKKAAKIKENIIFSGYIPEQELNQYFCAADLFLVPTLDLEGFGLVNLESLAMGVPVLATPQGGMLELEGKFDFFHLCKENSASALRESMVYYGEKYHNIIINESNIHAYSWGEIAEQYLKIFRRI